MKGKINGISELGLLDYQGVLLRDVFSVSPFRGVKSRMKMEENGNRNRRLSGGMYILTSEFV